MVSFHFTVTVFPFGRVSSLYRGRTRPSGLGAGAGRLLTMPGSAVPVATKFSKHHRGQAMPTASTATCVAEATSGTTSALKMALGTKTIRNVPRRFRGLGPVMHRPAQ